MNDIEIKYGKLRSKLPELKKIAVAFSAGVDSTFLLKTAKDTPEVDVLAITVRAASVPKREIEEAARFCGENGIRQIVIDVDQMSIENFRNNAPDRCYHCKKALFSAVVAEAKKAGYAHVAEGTNADDAKDYRPGMRALSELGVLSPLKDAGLTKAEIRELSQRIGLPTWNKPALACLATRFPCGETVTEEKLKAVEEAENYLFGLGFSQLRVRVHGDVARIETDPSEFEKIVAPETSKAVVKKLRSLGYRFVTLDLEGYKTGNMNEVHTD